MADQTKKKWVKEVELSEGTIVLKTISQERLTDFQRAVIQSVASYEDAYTFKVYRYDPDLQVIIPTDLVSSKLETSRGFLVCRRAFLTQLAGGGECQSLLWPTSDDYDILTDDLNREMRLKINLDVYDFEPDRYFVDHNTRLWGVAQLSLSAEVLVRVTVGCHFPVYSFKDGKLMTVFYSGKEYHPGDDHFTKLAVGVSEGLLIGPLARKLLGF